MTVEYRLCPSCRDWKPLTQFPSCPRSREGRGNPCNVCRYDRQIERLQRNRNREISRLLRYPRVEA